MTVYSLDILLSQFGTSLFFPCLVLIIASWPAYRFLRRQVRWSGIPIYLRIFHSLLWSTQSKALAKSIKQKQMFFWNSIAFLMIQQMLAIWILVPPGWMFKSSLNIWKFMVHVLLKPSLDNFEQYFAGMWDECICVVVWTFFGIAFLWDWDENWPFFSPVATTEFSKFAGILSAALPQHHLLGFERAQLECQHFH